MDEKPHHRKCHSKFFHSLRCDNVRLYVLRKLAWKFFSLTVKNSMVNLSTSIGKWRSCKITAEACLRLLLLSKWSARLIPLWINYSRDKVIATEDHSLWADKPLYTSYLHVSPWPGFNCTESQIFNTATTQKGRQDCFVIRSIKEKSTFWTTGRWLVR